MHDNPYILDQKMHDKVFEIIKKDFLSNSQSVEKPGLVITGGQPASGKRKLAGEATLDFANRGGSVIVDPNRLRQYHPNMKPCRKAIIRPHLSLPTLMPRRGALSWPKKQLKDEKILSLVHHGIYDKLANTVQRVDESKIVDRFTVYDRHYKPIQQKDFEQERNREFKQAKFKSA